MGKKNFKNKKSYLKWLAYGHKHHFFDKPGNQTIFIKGKKHDVVHKPKSLTKYM